MTWQFMRGFMALGSVVAVGCGGTSPQAVEGAAGNGGTDGSGGAASSLGGSAEDLPLEPGVPIAPPVVSAEAERLASLLTVAAEQTQETLTQAAAVSFASDLGFDPTAAAGLDLIQASNLALTDSELTLLGQNGFVIVNESVSPTFFHAYFTIYGEDLPVFVSADSILDALHRSFDDILKDLELITLVDQVRGLLMEMRSHLGTQDFLDETTARDADFFLAVALGLLEGAAAPVAGADSTEIDDFIAVAHAAGGILAREIFGVRRNIDFSQFKPRGHYEDDPVLQRYFRAMMWLGRIDFRMLETQPDGSQVFHRRQLEAALALRQLMDDSGLKSWHYVDDVVSAFVGEHDYMTVPELDLLLADLGVADASGLAAVTDQAIVEAIRAGGYGQQRIASHAMVSSGGPTLPLSSSFAFFGQRYTVDSHVFSNVVYDRAGNGTIPRWLPNPLDAAYAALGNDQAISLLSDELATYPYAADLAAMRTLVDAHPPEYWEGSLYTLWLGGLRSLSPAETGVGNDDADLPTVARTQAWGRRLLNTQLGSWSELRHDTLLYVKQSYTVGSVCDYPDAYVDPYPGLFERISRYAERGAQLLETLQAGVDTSDYRWTAMQGHFASLAEVSGILEEMAEYQRTGLQHSAEHLAFINDVVDIQSGGSGSPSVSGWYARLFYGASASDRALEDDPVIADVHTDPGDDQRGASVLHVATGRPRMMVVTVDGCSGPRAYVGPVFSYYEKVADGLSRMTDSEWAAELDATDVADVPWMEPIVAD